MIKRKFLLTAIITLLLILNAWGWQAQDQSGKALLLQERQAEWLVTSLMPPTTQKVAQPTQGHQDALTMMKFLEKEAKNADLDLALTKMEQKGENRVHLLFEQVGFDEFIAWLEQVRSSTGFSPNQIQINRLQHPGSVKAKAIF